MVATLKELSTLRTPSKWPLHLPNISTDPQHKLLSCFLTALGWTGWRPALLLQISFNILPHYTRSTLREHSLDRFCFSRYHLFLHSQTLCASWRLCVRNFCLSRWLWDHSHTEKSLLRLSINGSKISSASVIQSGWYLLPNPNIVLLAPNNSSLINFRYSPHQHLHSNYSSPNTLHDQ